MGYRYDGQVGSAYVYLGEVMKVIEQDELECWKNCYGEPLQLGLMVNTTEYCELPDFKNGTFMITSISFDEKGVNIGINDDGREDDFSVGYDGFRIDQLQPA